MEMLLIQILISSIIWHAYPLILGHLQVHIDQYIITDHWVTHWV